MTTKATTKQKSGAPEARRTRRARIAKKEEAPVQIIQVEGNLGIAQAESLHAQFCHALANDGEVVLDAENLAQVDASIVQLLHTLIREAKKNAVSVRWKDAPEELRQTAEMMGMLNGMGFDA